MLREFRELWRLVRIHLLFYSGRFDESVVYCSSLLERRPGEPYLNYCLGRAFFGRKDYLRAFWCLNTAIHRASPRSRLPGAVVYFFGVSAYHLGQNQRCIEGLERYRAQVGRVERHLNPSASLVKACFYLGYAYLKEARLELAAQNFEAVLRSGAIEDISVVVDLASIYCSDGVGRYEDAIRILTEALSLFPCEVELLKGLSYAHSLALQHCQSLRYARRALELCPGDLWIHQQIAYLYAQRDVLDLVGALRELELLLQQNPRDFWALEFKHHIRLCRKSRARTPSYLRLVET